MRYEPLAGNSIQGAAAQMCALAAEHHEIVTAEFNGIEISAEEGADAAAIVQGYFDESSRRHDEYVQSDAYKQRQEEARAAQEQRDATLAGVLLVAPEHMTLADGRADDWREFVEKNDDPYGGGVVRYAELWARVMEARIAAGDTVDGCARDASSVADTEGITGFMYGCAVGVLARCWVHGESLRQWHNLKTQIHDEGERANASGGVLNPAVLSIG